MKTHKATRKKCKEKKCKISVEMFYFGVQQKIDIFKLIKRTSVTRKVGQKLPEIQYYRENTSSKAAYVFNFINTIEDFKKCFKMQSQFKFLTSGKVFPKFRNFS
jgi:hypothetical protein